MALLALDIRQIVERVGVRRAQLQRRVVARLRLGHLAPLLQCVREVAVSIGEVGLQLDRLAVCVDCQLDMSCTYEDICFNSQYLYHDNATANSVSKAFHVCLYVTIFNT